MSSIRSSKGLTVAVALAVALVAVGTAAAITIDGSPPEATETGERVTATATVENPFQDQPDEWTLRGSTELENATWTVEVLAQGDPIDSFGAGGESFTTDLTAENGATDIEIEVTGTVPDIQTFNYDDLSAENYSALTVSRVTGETSAELRDFTVHRYTEASLDARQAIDEAIDSVGNRNDKIEDAISSYNGEQFGVAESLAGEAESGAESSQLLLIVAGVVIVLAIVAGVVYYWQQNRRPGNKLQ